MGFKQKGKRLQKQDYKTLIGLGLCLLWFGNRHAWL